MRENTMILVLLIGLGLIAMTSCASEDRSASETEHELAHPEVVFENDFAKVARVMLEPGQKLASHEGTDRLIYSLTDYSIDWIVNGESQGERNWSEGDVHVHVPDTHAAVNTGSTTAMWVAFARKNDVPDSYQRDLEHDVSSLEGDFAEVKFDGDLFRVIKVTLSPGAAIPSHEGTHRVIYSLSNYSILHESDETGTTERSFEAGDVHWHSPGVHSIQNIGESEARFLVIAYK